MDNTIILRTKVEDFINKIFLTNISDDKDPFFVLPFHSYRETLIDEFCECFNLKLDNDLLFLEQISDYIKINSIAMKAKPYWGGMLFRNHMHPQLMKFSEIWFSNILRYSRRDQLSIIHSALQSNLKINGFSLDNLKSDYHEWPVAKNKRIFRKSLNNIYKLPPDIFKEIQEDLLLDDEDIIKIDFSKKLKNLYSKFEKSFKEIENFEKEKRRLYSEIYDIKNSRIWRYSALFRKILDKIKLKKI